MPLKGLFSTDWQEEQWEKIPQEYRIDKWSFNFPLSQDQRNSLRTINWRDLGKNISDGFVLASERNHAINKYYTSISRRLSQCFAKNYNDTEFTLLNNWYHFGAWASYSAGEVIDGRSYNKVSLADQKLHALSSSVGLSTSKNKQRQIFSIINIMLALEFVPVGEAFLRDYCTEVKKTSDFDRWLNTNGQDEEEEFAKQGFRIYRNIVQKKYNPDDAKKQILKATILLVKSEQTQISELVEKVLTYKTSFLRSYVRAKMMDQVKIGNYNCSEHRYDYFSANKEMIVPHDIPNWLSDLSNDKTGVKQLVRYINLRPGESILDSACFDWADEDQRIQYLSDLFRILAADERINTAPVTTNF